MSLRFLLNLIFLFFILAASAIHSPPFFVLRVISLSFPLFFLIQAFARIARFLAGALLSSMDSLRRLIHWLLFLGAEFHFLMKFLTGFFGKVFRCLLTVAVAGGRRLCIPVGSFLMGVCRLGLLRGFLSAAVSGSNMSTFGVMFNFLFNFLRRRLSAPNFLMGFIGGIFEGLSFSLFLGPVYFLRAPILSFGRLFRRMFIRGRVSYFPQHLLEPIFLHLPVRSLVRIGCLSNSFRTYFQDRQFLRSRLERYRKPKLIISNGFDMIFVELEGTPPVVLPNPLSPNPNNGKIILCDLFSSIDGLILLGVYLITFEGGYYYIQKGLYNPSTRNFQMIPIPPSVEEQGGYKSTITSCIGYDLGSDDYKVVEILLFETPEIWIYSFNSKTWKRACNLSVHHELNGQEGSHRSTHLDGSIYIPVNHRIVQFRLCDEQVLIIPLLDENVNSRSLIVIDQALCTMRTNGPIEEFYKLTDGIWVPFLALEGENMLEWTLLGRSSDNRFLFNEGNHFLLYDESDGATVNLGVHVSLDFDHYLLVLETTFWPVRPIYE